MNTFAEEILRKLSEVDDFDAREFNGCSESEINALEQAHPGYIKLPAIYINFLQFAGKGLIYMQPASLFYYHNLLLFTSNEFLKNFNSTSFKEIYFENSSENIVFPRNGFIFCMHHGYQFRFFLCGEGDDPPVYFFSDDPDVDNFEKINLHLSTEILSFVDEFANIHKNKVAKLPEIQPEINAFKRHLLDIMDVVNHSNMDKIHNINILRNSYKNIYNSLYNIYIQPQVTSSKICSLLEDYLLVSATSDQDKDILESVISKTKELEAFFDSEIVQSPYLNK